MKSFFIFLAVSFLGSHLFAEGWIVRFRDQTQATQFLKKGYYPPEDQIPLIPEMNLYLIKKPREKGNIRYFEASFKMSPLVSYIAPDRPVKKRGVDPLYRDQWYLHSTLQGGIQAISAWKVTTGGKNALGEDLVAAVVDDGFDLNHEDLKENVWVNRFEVPDNGIDDDLNGFIDDVHGWNSFKDNGAIESEDHGTHVAAIIGAPGDNHIGIAGLNWHGQLMLVSGADSEFSVVAKSYGYIMRQKLRWIKSHGFEGANVVVINSSFGEDEAQCMTPEFQIWNDIYNELGRLGILSVASVTNSPGDVDVMGDVPSTCESPFLITVNSVDTEGHLFPLSGWGKKSVDLSAPGYHILSAVAENRYEELTGNSMAAPQVAGVLMLMFSAASKEFISFYHKNPAIGAIQMKEALLKGVDRLPDLLGTSVSGGRLHAGQAVMRARALKSLSSN